MRWPRGQFTAGRMLVAVAIIGMLAGFVIDRVKLGSPIFLVLCAVVFTSPFVCLLVVLHMVLFGRGHSGHRGVDLTAGTDCGETRRRKRRFWGYEKTLLRGAEADIGATGDIGLAAKLDYSSERLPQFALWRLMAAVAVVGVMCGLATFLGSLWWRAFHQPSRAEVAASLRLESDHWERLAKENPSLSKEFRRLAEQSRRAADRLDRRGVPDHQEEQAGSRRLISSRRAVRRESRHFCTNVW
jgi:hypothetical protein